MPNYAAFVLNRTNYIAQQRPEIIVADTDEKAIEAARELVLAHGCDVDLWLRERQVVLLKSPNGER